jgi:hypothetical protein
MQNVGEDGALDGKLKTAAREQLAQHLGNAEPLPKPPELERPANARAGDATRLHVGQDDRARWHHRDAIMPATGQRPVQPITVGTGVVAGGATLPFCSAAPSVCENPRTVLENPDLADLAASAVSVSTLGDGELKHTTTDAVQVVSYLKCYLMVA